MTTEAQDDLLGLLDRISDETDGDRVSVGDLLRLLGHRGFGSALVLTSLLALLPTGAIPGMSLLTGAIMLLISAQLAVGSDRIWLPGFITRRSLPRDTLMQSMDKAKAWAKRIGRLVGPRMELLVRPPWTNLLGGFGVLLSLTMFPLALVPFGAFPAGVSFIVIGLGLAVRDGLLVTIGLLAGAVGLYVTWTMWPL